MVHIKKKKKAINAGGNIYVLAADLRCYSRNQHNIIK